MTPPCVLSLGGGGGNRNKRSVQSIKFCLPAVDGYGCSWEVPGGDGEVVLFPVHFNVPGFFTGWRFPLNEQVDAACAGCSVPGRGILGVGVKRLDDLLRPRLYPAFLYAMVKVNASKRAVR